MAGQGASMRRALALTANGIVATNRAGLTLGGNLVSRNVNVNGNGPGRTVVKANNISLTLACSGNEPPPTNAGQPNTAGAKAGQCVGL